MAYDRVCTGELKSHRYILSPFTSLSSSLSTLSNSLVFLFSPILSAFPPAFQSFLALLFRPLLSYSPVSQLSVCSLPSVFSITLFSSKTCSVFHPLSLYHFLSFPSQDHACSLIVAYSPAVASAPAPAAAPASGSPRQRLH